MTGAFAVLADRLLLRPMRGRGLDQHLHRYGRTRLRHQEHPVHRLWRRRPQLRRQPGRGLRTRANPRFARPDDHHRRHRSSPSAFVGWLLASTTIGRSMRAVAENSDLAAVTGVNTERLAMVTWLLAGCLAGLAGVCLGLVQGTFDANFGAYILLLIFTAVVLGGIGSAYGALAGGIVLGLAMEVSTWDGFAGGLDPRYKIVLAFVALILLLLLPARRHLRQGSGFSDGRVLALRPRLPPGSTRSSRWGCWCSSASPAFRTSATAPSWRSPPTRWRLRS